MRTVCVFFSHEKKAGRIGGRASKKSGAPSADLSRSYKLLLLRWIRVRVRSPASYRHAHGHVLMAVGGSEQHWGKKWRP